MTFAEDRRRRRFPRLLPRVAAAGVLGLGTALVAGQAPQTPVFRGETNIFHIDVSVQDKQRRHVSGFTAADFSVIENGTPRRVVAVSEITVRPPVAPTAAWLRDVAPDVIGNHIDARRLIVLAIESLGRLGSRAAHAIVDSLGPDDLMAVAFIGSKRGAQDFTSDRARLHEAVNHEGMFLPLPDEQRETAPDICRSGLLQSLSAIAESLEDVPDRRKLVFYLGGGLNLDFIPATGRADLFGCQAINLVLFAELMRHAQISNTNFYPIDPNGLRPFTEAQIRAREAKPDLSLDFLQVLAANTGGHAIVKNNRPDLDVPKRMAEAASYYLVGYEMAARPNDGELYRRIEVKVDRPGVEVRARTRYYEPAVKKEDAGAAAVAPASAAIRGLLPDRGLPLTMALAPFASDTPGKANINIALGLDGGPVTGESAGSLDVVIHAFDHDGKSFGRSEHRVAMEASESAQARHELTSTMDLPAGSYEVRAAVHDRRTGRAGSVYATVVVPDFARAPLTMSGVLVDARPALPSIALASSLSRATLTARRDFSATDIVLNTVRVYQGGSRALAPIAMSVRVVDDQDRKVLATDETLAPERFGPQRWADYRVALPLTTLAPGEYLLTIDGKLDARTTVRRHVRFTRR